MVFAMGIKTELVHRFYHSDSGPPYLAFSLLGLWAPKGVQVAGPLAQQHLLSLLQTGRDAAAVGERHVLPQLL